LVCPVTSKAKGYPFEVSVRAGRIGGVALADQVRSVDWRLRRAKLAARADNIAVQSALSKARLLL
jgi:mRNA interferase MazF